MAISRKDNKGRKLKDGEVYRSDGRYCYRYTDIRTGKRASIYAQDLPELREKEKKIEKDMEDNILTDGEIKKMTLNTLFDTYINTKEIAESTKANYINTWNNRVKDEIGNIKVIQLLPSHVKSFYAKLARAGYSHSTIKLIHDLLFPALEMAVDDDMIRKNPSKNALGNYGREPEERTALTTQQQEQLLQFTQNHNIYNMYLPMLTIMIGTGVRTIPMTQAVRTAFEEQRKINFMLGKDRDIFRTHPKTYRLYQNGRKWNGCKGTAIHHGSC